MSTMCNFNLNLTLPEGVVLPGGVADLTHNRAAAFARIAAFFDALAAGMEPGAVGETKVVASKGSTAAAAVRAYGTITFSGATGTVGATVAGTAKTFAHGASDAADATTLAANINADATLNKLVEAAAVGAVVTITAIQPGVLGNQITLAASGTGVSAGNVSGGKMQSGVGGDGAPTTISF